MNRIVRIATPVFAAALIAGTLVGCGGQAASSGASDSAASASVTSPASQSAETQATTEETVAQLKTAMENANNFKSVTVTHKVGIEADASQAEQLASAQSASSSASAASSADSAESSDNASAADSAAAAPTSVNITNVYKLDQSGETMKACSSTDLQGSTINTYLDGDKVVVDFDGDAYAGTTEEMDVNELTSIEALLKTKVGDFDTITSCVSAADVVKQGDNTVYALTIDTEKYAEADEVEKALSEAGLQKELFTVSYEFGADGKLLSVSVLEKTALNTTEATLNFTDYDATVVDQAPETNKTYADMNADIQAAVDDLNLEDQGALQSQ